MSTLSQFFTGGNPEGLAIDLLMVGGGGGGGSAQFNNGVTSQNSSGGGGGAGEYFEVSGFLIPKGQTIAITVGSGGSADTDGGSSALSINNLLITVEGGGKGGNGITPSSPSSKTGASGGGGGARNVTGVAGGTGGGTRNVIYSGAVLSASLTNSAFTSVTKSFSDQTATRYANNGGLGYAPGGTGTEGGGGGGAGSVGASGSATGNGGTGQSSLITGSIFTYAEGGGANPASVNSNGSSATANTGSGGIGGAASSSSGTILRSGGSGGSGVVIIACPDIYAAPTSVTGTYNMPSRTGYRVYRFTGNGTITF